MKKLSTREYNILKNITKYYNNILMNMDLFVDVFVCGKDYFKDLTLSCARINIQNGKFATLLGKNIFVSRELTKPLKSDMRNFQIRVSNKVDIDISSDELHKWSPLFELEDFDKFRKLQSFW